MNDLNIEARMLFKSLCNDPGLTALQLCHLWSPTWSLEHVQAMLNLLMKHGYVTERKGYVVRYDVAIRDQAVPQYEYLAEEDVWVQGANHANT